MVNEQNAREKEIQNHPTKCPEETTTLESLTDSGRKLSVQNELGEDLKNESRPKFEITTTEKSPDVVIPENLKNILSPNELKLIETPKKMVNLTSLFLKPDSVQKPNTNDFNETVNDGIFDIQKMREKLDEISYYNSNAFNSMDSIDNTDDSNTEKHYSIVEPIDDTCDINLENLNHEYFSSSFKNYSDIQKGHIFMKDVFGNFLDVTPASSNKEYLDADSEKHVNLIRSDTNSISSDFQQVKSREPYVSSSNNVNNPLYSNLKCTSEKNYSENYSSKFGDNDRLTALTEFFESKGRRTTGVILGAIVFPKFLYEILKITVNPELLYLLQISPQGYEDGIYSWDCTESAPKNLTIEYVISKNPPYVTMVENGTLMDLVFFLTESCDHIHKYIEIFIHSYRHFANSVDVMRILVVRHILADIHCWKPFTSKSIEVASSFKKSHLQNCRRLITINIVRKWMSLRQEDFLEDSTLVLIAKKFLEYNNTLYKNNEKYTSGTLDQLTYILKNDPLVETLGVDDDDFACNTTINNISNVPSNGNEFSKTQANRLSLACTSPIDSLSLRSNSSRLHHSSTTQKRLTFTFQLNSSNKSNSDYLLYKDHQSIAQALCTIDHGFILKITVDELSAHIWATGGSKGLKSITRNLMQSIEWFNKISNCVASSILLQKTPKRRSNAIQQYIKTALSCLSYCNFSSCFAIYSGLSSTPIARLKLSWAKISQDSMNSWKKLQRVISTDNSYREYRTLLTDAINKGDKYPFIPYFGITLSDVAFTNVGNRSFIYPVNEKPPPAVSKCDLPDKDIVYSGVFASYLPAVSTRINFAKFRAIHKITEIVECAKKRSYNIPLHPILHDYLINNWPSLGDENDLISISYALEPKK